MAVNWKLMVLAGVMAAPNWAPAWAQDAAPAPADPMQTVTADRPAKGPDVKGIITARSGNRMQITAEDGTKSVVALDDATVVKASSGFLGMGRNKLGASALINGLPVTVKTLNYGDRLVAGEVTMRNNDLKMANMIRGGTEQGFAEQTAATEALKGRMADIDNYNIKGTTNVYFDTGKWAIAEPAKAELCAAAAQAGQTPNALLLVVGYTDSVGNEEYNQTLSERRASRVMNHLQQACGWKPYRMLTPTGMAESDPAADNATEQGRAQNRRVMVNVLVSKAVDGF